MGMDKTPTLGAGQRVIIMVQIKGPLNQQHAQAFDTALNDLLQQFNNTSRAGVVVQGQ